MNGTTGILFLLITSAGQLETVPGGIALDVQEAVGSWANPAAPWTCGGLS